MIEHYVGPVALHKSVLVIWASGPYNSNCYLGAKHLDN